MVNFEGEVRRIDLLLRTEFVNIDTVIYKVAENDYQIFSEQFEDSFSDFEVAFKEIRFMNLPVRLMAKAPDSFEKIVQPIDDHSISKNFEGMPMTIIDFYNLLLIKFADANIYKIEGSQPIIIRVYALKEKTAMGTTIHYLSKDNRRRLMEFLTGLGIATTYEIIEDEVDEPPRLDEKLVHNPVQFLNSNKLWNKETGEFSDRDEALWFDNIDNIYTGTFRKDDLYFYQHDKYACYLDYTSAQHIDIRNFLLLYQTIYLTPPFSPI